MTETQLKSEALARFVVETPVEAVPDAMMKKAVRHILDSVGAGVAGAISKEARGGSRLQEDVGALFARHRMSPAEKQ